MAAVRASAPGLSARAEFILVALAPLQVVFKSVAAVPMVQVPCCYLSCLVMFVIITIESAERACGEHPDRVGAPAGRV